MYHGSNALQVYFPKCIYPKGIFAKCTQLACLLSFASLNFAQQNSKYGKIAQMVAKLALAGKPR